MSSRSANNLVEISMSHEEIGQILGVSRSTVGDIERRAMEKIRRMRTPVAQRMLGYFEHLDEKSEAPDEYRVSDEVHAGEALS
ncbi:sigma factor-like helix-turn-helix DNA-binding protein [Pseudohongiella sp. O18]|uniref:sigma factor-like helix-turn-helix DNA-binding protein n=1 Tax=Pseudohongiella sp. O18 TaxID=2904248 RepID=UPI001F33289F|nr:sigma factor-like helix-turn-helix DNA-binding protein [Pseudohongiella sp. O18]